MYSIYLRAFCSHLFAIQKRTVARKKLEKRRSNRFEGAFYVSECAEDRTGEIDRYATLFSLVLPLLLSFSISFFFLSSRGSPTSELYFSFMFSLKKKQDAPRNEKERRERKTGGLPASEGARDDCNIEGV